MDSFRYEQSGGDGLEHGGLFKGKVYGPGHRSVSGVPLEGTFGFQCLSVFLTFKIIFQRWGYVEIAFCSPVWC